MPLMECISSGRCIEIHKKMLFHLFGSDRIHFYMIHLKNFTSFFYDTTVAKRKTRIIPLVLPRSLNNGNHRQIQGWMKSELEARFWNNRTNIKQFHRALTDWTLLRIQRAGVCSAKYIFAVRLILVSAFTIFPLCSWTSYIFWRT